MTRSVLRPCFVGLSMVGLIAGTSCQRDAKPASTASPEDRRVSAAEVATGLRQIEAIATQVPAMAGNPDGEAVKIDTRIEPVWRRIEGTVKANDQNAYLAFEDAFVALASAAKHNNSPRARAASDSVGKTIAAYLGRYPG